MSNEQSVAENVLGEFAVNCQHIGGQVCFVPTNAVQEFVARCKEGKLIMAHGEVYSPEEDYAPIVTFLRGDLLTRIEEFAARANMSVPEFVGAILVSTIDDEDTVEKLGSIIRSSSPMDSVPAPGETAADLPMGDENYVSATESDGPPDPWAFNADYMQPAERDPNHDYGSQKIPKIDHGSVDAAREVLAEHQDATELSNNVLPRLKAVLGRIHIGKEGPLEIWIGAHSEDHLQLNLKYPQEGFDIKESYEGDFDECLDKVAARLDRWSDVAFSPKMEEGEEAVAEVGVKIMGFDKSQGKYKAMIGESVIFLSPEMVGKGAV